jgi:L-alanine-DL-glutamate epimerase-like enolase superfamily enzyme
VLAAGQLGRGYTYADGCITALICGALAKALEGRDALDIPGCWLAMQRTVRNLGRSGLAACAISAIDSCAVGSQGEDLAPSLARRNEGDKTRRSRNLLRASGLSSIGTTSEATMNGLIYLVGLVVVIMFILSFLGLR